MSDLDAIRERDAEFAPPGDKYVDSRVHGADGAAAIVDRRTLIAALDAQPVGLNVERLAEIVSDSLAACTEGTEWAEAPQPSDEPGSLYVLRLTNEIASRYASTAVGVDVAGLREAVRDLHRWDESRGWSEFNAILARMVAILGPYPKGRAALASEPRP